MIDLVIKYLLTGIALGMGFYFKDHLINFFQGWKGTIESNLANGQRKVGSVFDKDSIFFNPASVKKQEWRTQHLSFKAPAVKALI